MAIDHTLVLHNSSGAKVSCATLVRSGDLYEPMSTVDVCGTCGGPVTDASMCQMLGLNAYFNAVQFCPYPMLPTSSSPHGVGSPEGYPCQVPCRTPHYDEDDMDNMDTFFKVFTSISFVFISYTFASVVRT